MCIYIYIICKFTDVMNLFQIFPMIFVMASSGLPRCKDCKDSRPDIAGCTWLPGLWFFKQILYYKNMVLYVCM